MPGGSGVMQFYFAHEFCFLHITVWRTGGPAWTVFDFSWEDRWVNTTPQNNQAQFSG
jgi:hypothetical protein